MKISLLERFMYGLMKEARRGDFTDFLENWEISEEEYDEIVAYFESTYSIKL